MHFSPADPSFSVARHVTLARIRLKIHTCVYILRICICVFFVVSFPSLLSPFLMLPLLCLMACFFTLSNGRCALLACIFLFLFAVNIPPLALLVFLVSVACRSSISQHSRYVDFRSIPIPSRLALSTWRWSACLLESVFNRYGVYVSCIFSHIVY